MPYTTEHNILRPSRYICKALTSKIRARYDGNGALVFLMREREIEVRLVDMVPSWWCGWWLIPQWGTMWCKLSVGIFVPVSDVFMLGLRGIRPHAGKMLENAMVVAKVQIAKTSWMLSYFPSESVKGRNRWKWDVIPSTVWQRTWPKQWRQTSSQMG